MCVSWKRDVDMDKVARGIACGGAIIIYRVYDSIYTEHVEYIGRVPVSFAFVAFVEFVHMHAYSPHSVWRVRGESVFN